MIDFTCNQVYLEIFVENDQIYLFSTLLFMHPFSEKLRKHIGLGLYICLSICNAGGKMKNRLC